MLYHTHHFLFSNLHKDVYFLLQDNVRRGKSSVPKSRTISENGSNSFELNGVHPQNMHPPESNGNSIHKVDLYPESKPTHSPIPPPVQPRPPPEGHPGSRNGIN